MTMITALQLLIALVVMRIAHLNWRLTRRIRKGILEIEVNDGH